VFNKTKLIFEQFKINQTKVKYFFNKFNFEFFVNGFLNQYPAATQTYLSLVAERRLYCCFHHLFPIAISKNNIRVFATEFKR